MNEGIKLVVPMKGSKESVCKSQDPKMCAAIKYVGEKTCILYIELKKYFRKPEE